jgi:hypothetical protein
MSYVPLIQALVPIRDEIRAYLRCPTGNPVALRASIERGRPSLERREPGVDTTREEILRLCDAILIALTIKELRAVASQPSPQPVTDMCHKMALMIEDLLPYLESRIPAI